LEAQRQQQTEELRKLESQIEQMQVAIQQAQSMITSQAADLENRRNDLKQQEQALTEQRTTAAQTWGRVNLYQEMLQPIQDRVDALRQQLDAMSGTVSADIQAAVDNQLLAIAEIRQTLMSLTDIPELAAS
jgi:chromosome segregation ATPase